MAVIEGIISATLLYFLVKYIHEWLPEKHQIPKEIYRKSLVLNVLIVLIISFIIRFIFEHLGSTDYLIDTLNNVEFHFAIMISIYFPLHYIFIKKRYNSLFADKQLTRNYLLIKILIVLVIIVWGVALVFTSIGFLGITLVEFTIREIDIVYLGFIWAFIILFLEVKITSLINKLRSNEKRLPKEVLRNGMIVASIVSFGVWSIQIIIVEVYLYGYFRIPVYEQDIRLLIAVVTGVYIATLSFSLKTKFIPDANEYSKLKVREALELDKIQHSTIQEEEDIILEIQNLTTYFYTEEGVVRAVEGVSFEIVEGEVLGLVGETGCGKSVTALSILQLVRPPGKIEKGKVLFRGIDLIKQKEEQMLEYRGKDITMIFQDPLNSINPVYKVGDQISEVYLLHMEKELLIEVIKNPEESIYSIAKQWSQELLRDLNIPAPEKVIDRYPHELSGGMRQRIQIAMGLACRPKLLIADEPTTALDVTIQNQILKLMKELKKKYNTSILFITHDLGIISKMCDRVAVMYSGFIVEYGNIQKLFSNPYHPYSRGLISSVPVVGKKRHRLEIIEGMVPNLIYPPSGCRFHPRCRFCFEPCDSKVPKSIEVESNYFVACHLYDPDYKELAKISMEKVGDEEGLVT
jgi:oligopeptide/dipeptide ABC transporter ATP-binding protein